jgi:lipoprotein-releasing system ATP-binding protein
MPLALETKHITKKYIYGDTSHDVLMDVNLQIERGKSALLLGNSGCGKSTFLQIAGLIQDPTSGEIWIDEQNATKMPADKRNQLLRKKIGFIYQFHYLFNDFTAKENLIIPQLICNVSRKKAENRAMEMLDMLKMSHRAEAMPNELSGGERQRIAIARAIIKKPLIILADEPTGNLDNEMSAFVVNEMLELVKKNNIALLMVSHSHDFNDRFDDVYEVKGGRLEMRG